jgi:hypothetical protein
MSFNFPDTPTLGQAYGNYTWDGEKWQLPGNVYANRSSIYAAPFDALAYSGMQINGSMVVSQELGSTGFVDLASNSKYIVDGWYGNSAGAQAIRGQQNPTVFPPGHGAAVQLQVNGTANPSPASSDNVLFQQRIEGYRAARLAWGTPNAQPLTVAFWVYANRVGTYSVSVTNASTNRSYVATFSVTAVQTWEYKTVTIPGDTAGTWAKDNTVGIFLSVVMMTGSALQTAPGVWTAGTAFFGATGMTNGVAAVSDYMLLSGVVVLPGIEAPSAARSALIMRPFDQELVTCQRYWEATEIDIISYGAAGTAQAACNVAFSVEKRSNPTAVMAAQAYFNCTLNAYTATKKINRVLLNVAVTGNWQVAVTINNDARL